MFWADGIPMAIGCTAGSSAVSAIGTTIKAGDPVEPRGIYVAGNHSPVRIDRHVIQITIGSGNGIFSA
jgi:hypothetical protein